MKKSKKIVTFLESEEQQPEYSTADGETEHRHTLTWDDGVLKSHGPADEGEKHDHDIKERSDGSYFLDKGGKDGHTHEAPESINQSESQEEEDLMITPPFKKGVKAKEKGKLINDNPYEQGSKEAIDWADGWASMLSGSSLRPFQLRPANDDGQPTGKGFDNKAEGNEMNRTSKLVNRILEMSSKKLFNLLVKEFGSDKVVWPSDYFSKKTKEIFVTSDKATFGDRDARNPDNKHKAIFWGDEMSFRFQTDGSDKNFVNKVKAFADKNNISHGD
jgi:hypothetical protein